MTSSPRSPIGPGILAVVCLAGGVGMTAFFGLPMYRRAQASLTWPTTTGTIQTSELQKSFQKGKTRYSPSVSYAYEVDGTPRTFNYIWASGGDSSGDQSRQQAVVDKYPVGSTVKVFYDPENPDFAILEPGITATNSIVLGGGGAILLAGVIMAGVAIVRIVRLPSQPADPTPR